MWFDNWHPLSPLLDHFGSCILLDSAYPRTAKLESFIRGSSWNWHMASSLQFLELIQTIPYHISPCGNGEDSVSWTKNQLWLFHH